ncbi:MAG: IPT/TIG domain-containing protein [Bacteroidales bacterium]|jgi:hypothetical protein|nr:IPT/TIG domain-containing protein [Bacteroidales bacterium]
MAVPAITSLTPSSGDVAGGTTVTIVGTDLHTATSIAFGATPATYFASHSATLAVAVAPAGTGTVNVTLTTAGGTSAAASYTYGSVLFSVAEARAFDKLQLASATTYPAAAIAAKESEIRAAFEKICGVAFVPTTVTTEAYDGDGSASLILRNHRVTAVTAISIDGTALTAGELSTTDYSGGLAIDALTGVVTRRSGIFASGRQNVLVSYTHGWASVPAMIKRAALIVCINEMKTSDVPANADSYGMGGVSMSFTRGDGYQENWYSYPEVVKALRMYNERDFPVA